MELNPHEEIVFRHLHSFDDVAIRRCAADYKPCIYQALAIVIIKLVAVAVALGNFGLLIAALHYASRCYFARISSESECTALVYLVALVRQKVYDLVL